MIALRHFAENHRLRLGRGEDGELLVRAKLGHIYQHDEERLAVIILADANDLRLDNTLRSRIHTALRSGFEPHQVADFEAVLLFEGSDVRLARLAVKLVECRRKRRAKFSPAFLKARDRFKFKTRTQQEAPETTLEATIWPRPAPSCQERGELESGHA